MSDKNTFNKRVIPSSRIPKSKKKKKKNNNNNNKQTF